MTTIAYKDGWMVGDTYRTLGDNSIGPENKVFTFKSKKYRPFQMLVGGSGEMPIYMAMVRSLGLHEQDLSTTMPDLGFTGAWLEEPISDDAHAKLLIAVKTEGLLPVLYYWWSHDLSPVEISKPYFAIGSGADIAIGAMAAGMTAKQAVEIATQHDVYTREPVYGLSFTKEES